MVRAFGRSSLAVAVAALLIAVAVGCGSGGGHHAGSASGSAALAANTNASAQSPAAAEPVAQEVVARFDGTPIVTRGEVNQWMKTVAGGSYYELSRKHTIPEGLVSDPPNYPRCVSQLEATAAAAPSKLYNVPTTHLLKKCQEMYRALRYSAMELLIAIQFVIDLAKYMQIGTTDKEVLAAYNKSNAPLYPTPAALAASQAARKVTTSEELLLMKKDVLANKILARLKKPGTKPSVLIDAEAVLAAKTDCRPGYVVEHCKQFHNPPPHVPSGAVLMEQVAAIATGRCTNLPACGKP
jgi:hypothetical protein